MMRSGIDKILRDVQSRPYSLKNVPIEALHAIWNGLCAHIHSVLANGKVRLHGRKSLPGITRDEPPTSPPVRTRLLWGHTRSFRAIHCTHVVKSAVACIQNDCSKDPAVPAWQPPTPPLSPPQGMSVLQFGTWSFHLDTVDLGTQRKVLRTPVFSLSERFARQYNLRWSRGPSGISGAVPVRDLNVMAIGTPLSHALHNPSYVLRLPPPAPHHGMEMCTVGLLLSASPSLSVLVRFSGGH